MVRAVEYERSHTSRRTRDMRRTALAALVAITLSGPATLALAQQPGHGGMTMQGAGANTPASRGYMGVMQSVQRNMNMPMTGNADRDFLAMMIPHHQSAVDMAKVVLQHGSDPEVRALAETIIRDQEREIGQMRTILQRLPAR